MFGTPELIDSESGDFQTIALKKLSALIKPNKERLHELAVARSQAIANHLTTKEIAIDRLFLLDVDIDAEEPSNAIASTLNLIVN